MSTANVDSIAIPDFRARLREELARRRKVNRRYSLRAFADLLGVDHSTLSQVLRNMRPVPAGCARDWARRLKLSGELGELYAAAEDGDDFEALGRRMRHMQWMAEAAAVTNNAAHWRLLQLLRAPDWRPDMRWAAQRLDIDADQLSDALLRLLRLGLLTMHGREWRDTSGLESPVAENVVDLALARLRHGMSVA